MSEKISTPHLISCLSEKQKYKATTTYLHEATKFNEEVYNICNEALLAILIDQNNNYLAKLLALRFFKELFVTGNITLIDSLDEQIEEEIVQIAQFNKKSKQINRGANYFIERYNLKKDAQIQKIGASFVILATEIIVVFAKWYPFDENKESTRFADYHQKLSSFGVTFPKDKTYNFFKKQEEEKFKKNYQTWLKWYIENVKEEEVEETVKQIVQNKSGESALEQKQAQLPMIKKQNISINNHQKIQKTNQTTIEKHEVKKQMLPQMLQSETKQVKLTINQSSNILKQSKVQSKQFSIQVNIPHPQDKNNQNSLEKALKQNKQKTSQHETQVQNLKKKIQEIQKVSDGAKKSFQKQNEFAQNELIIKDKTIQAIKRQNDNLRDEITKLKSELTLKSQNTQIKQFQTKTECYQIKISPPKVYQDLEQQNQILSAALEAAEHNFAQKSKTYESQIAMLQEQNKNLKTKMTEKDRETDQKIKQLEQIKSNKINHAQYVKNIMQEDSLIVEDQPKIQFKDNGFLKQIQKHEINDKQNNTRSASITQHRHEIPKRHKQSYTDLLEGRSRSLKKTESQHRLNRNYNTFSNTGFGMALKTTSKLNKTTNNFYKKPSQHNNNYVTFYPYLDNYFPALPIQSIDFKELSLQAKVHNLTCFQNDLIKGSITKNNSNKYILTLFNHSRQDLKIKLLSGHYSFAIKGEKSRKITSMSQSQFEITAQNIDLNLRYPIVSVMVGTQRLSLTNSVPHDRNIHIPLPVTLLDFCTIYPEKGTQWLSDFKLTKFSSNKISISKCIPSIEKCLQPFKITYQQNEIIASAGLTLNGCLQSKIFVEIILNHSELWVNIQFGTRSNSSCSLSKVVMQALLFLLQK